MVKFDLKSVQLLEEVLDGVKAKEIRISNEKTSFQIEFQLPLPALPFVFQLKDMIIYVKIFLRGMDQREIVAFIRFSQYITKIG